MLVNYYDKYEINTDDIEEKLSIISKYDTENASFINHTFKNTINYLFMEEKLNTNNLCCDIPDNIDKETIVIFFDNYIDDAEHTKVSEISSISKFIIIVGNHKTKSINDKIKLINIKHFAHIKSLLKDEKIQIGFNSKVIDNSQYYYGRMRNYFLNLLDKLNKLSVDDLKRDVEGECTKILLDEENFKSHFVKNNLIKMRRVIKFYDKLISLFIDKKIVNEKVFYFNADNNGYTISLLNSLSELFWLYYNKSKEERISYVYDVICSQMLEETKKIDYCFFKNNICVTARNTNNSFPNSKENGCCNNTYKDKNKNCRYLKDDHSCSICSISCRVFTCGYLQKRGMDHSLWQYPLIDCVFSKLARPRIIYGFFTPKEKMIKRMR